MTEFKPGDKVVATRDVWLEMPGGRMKTFCKAGDLLVVRKVGEWSKGCGQVCIWASRRDYSMAFAADPKDFELEGQE